MPSNLKKIDFSYDDMTLDELFYDNNYQPKYCVADTKGVNKVLSRPLCFDNIYEDRPFVFNSIVTSIDGKMAFLDKPQGPLIAKANKYAGYGQLADYWILNVLRGSADAILTGTVAINAEVNTGGTGHCYDEEIEIYREQIGKNPVPLGIVVTIDGDDINYNAKIFNSDEKVIVFYSTLNGYEKIKSNNSKNTIKIDENTASLNYNDLDANNIYVICTDEQELNHKVGMSILKRMGIDFLLVESPTVAHVFMRDKILDELFINTSCLYVGGKAPSMGYNFEAFTTENHPHTRFVSIHKYQENFMYCRYKLIYD